MNVFKISIPKPCHENWQEMTPEDKGRFCGMCQKTVVDFTQMKDSEISDFFETHKEQKVCGRFESSQLENKNIHLKIPQKLLLSQTSFRKIFMLALFLTMGSTLLSCKDHNDHKISIGTPKSEEHLDKIPVTTGMVLVKVDEEPISSNPKASQTTPAVPDKTVPTEKSTKACGTVKGKIEYEPPKMGDVEIGVIYTEEETTNTISDTIQPPKP